MSKLEEARLKINQIDRQMAELYEQRMVQSAEVADYKIRNGLPVYDASRADEVIRHNMAHIKDPVIREYYVTFLKSMMETSKAYQGRIMQGMKVSYSGVPGAFAHVAAQRLFPDAALLPYPDFESAYQACEEGAVDAVVLPVENSFAGDVGIVLDLIFSGSLYINQMIDLEVVQNLLGLPGTSVDQIRTVISHPQALSQCFSYIREHQYNAIEYANTAIAAKEVIEKGDRSVAAIASAATADLYGLEVIEHHINTSNNNTTRFAAFTRTQNLPEPHSKMGEHFSLVFTVLNEAGALAKTLNIIGAHGFNMRNLRSRPMKELKWSYFFFVELEGNVNSEDGEDLLRQLGTVCDRLKLVGAYRDL